MIQTYRALLQGNRLEWLEEIPKSMADKTSFPVQVTIDTQDRDETKAEDERERQKRVLLLLELLSQTGAFSDIQDASAWQREIRLDRPLPNRR